MGETISLLQTEDNEVSPNHSGIHFNQTGLLRSFASADREHQIIIGEPVTVNPNSKTHVLKVHIP